MVNEIMPFDYNFDRMVSLLSIKGYYLKGFIENSESCEESYLVFNRISNHGKPVARIYRSKSIEFIADGGREYSKNDAKKIRKILERTLDKPKVTKVNNKFNRHPKAG